MSHSKCKAISSLFGFAAKPRSAAASSKPFSSSADDATLKNIVSSPDAFSSEFLEKSPKTSIAESDDLGEKEQLFRSFESLFIGDKEENLSPNEISLSARRKARERKHKVVYKNTEGGRLACSQKIDAGHGTMGRETSEKDNALRIVQMLKNLR